MKISQQLQSLLAAQKSTCSILNILDHDSRHKNFTVVCLASGHKDYLRTLKTNSLLVISDDTYGKYGIWSYLAFNSLQDYLKFKFDGSIYPVIFDFEYPTFEACLNAALADSKQNAHLFNSSVKEI